MAKKSKKSIQKALPIVFVPDKSYMDDTGDIILTDAILVIDFIMYERISRVLEVWGKEPMGVPGKRGDIEG